MLYYRLFYSDPTKLVYHKLCKVFLSGKKPHNKPCYKKPVRHFSLAHKASDRRVYYKWSNLYSVFLDTAQTPIQYTTKISKIHLAERVGVEPTNPLRDSGFRNRWNNHYPTSPIISRLSCGSRFYKDFLRENPPRRRRV